MPLDGLKKIVADFEAFDLDKIQADFIASHEKEIQALFDQGKTKEEIQKEFLFSALQKIAWDDYGMPLKITELEG